MIQALIETSAPMSAEAIASSLGLRAEILDTLLAYVSGVDTILTEGPEGYALSDFGRAVVQRYGKTGAQGTQVNLFDVRTGAYGPVWANLSGLLTGQEVYGETLHREGRYAERGLYTSAKGMAPALLKALPRGPVPVVELGVETGLLECLGKARPEIQLFGLDRNSEALQKCGALAAREGVEGIQWLHADLFDVEAWEAKLPRDVPGVFYTIHLHEFMAAGEEAVSKLIQKLIQNFKGWRFVAIEQPRLEKEARDLIPASRWLYSQSNILIHHLIKNGRILSRGEWMGIFRDGGAHEISVTETGYLDYLAYVVRLSGGAGAP